MVVDGRFVMCVPLRGPCKWMFTASEPPRFLAVGGLRAVHLSRERLACAISDARRSASAGCGCSNDPSAPYG